jgi:hypothetical protein
MPFITNYTIPHNSLYVHAHLAHSCVVCNNFITRSHACSAVVCLRDITVHDCVHTTALRSCCCRNSNLTDQLPIAIPADAFAICVRVSLYYRVLYQ